METEEEIPEWYPSKDVMNKDVMMNSKALTKIKYDEGTGVEYMESNRTDYADFIDSDLPSDDDSSESSRPDRKRFKLLSFHHGADVSSIPIQKDGMAVCEKCGTIGVKHAFYSKSKRFCSLDCSRTYKTLEREGKPIPKPQPVFKFPLSKVKIYKKGGLTKKRPTQPNSTLTLAQQDLSNSFNWEAYLKLDTFFAAPVSSFKHVPLNDCWDSIMVAMKVEVENRDYDELRELFPHSYWVAGVIQVSGYKARLRYEGFGNDSSEDFWLNMCKEHVQPVGWCANQGKPLIPPKSVQHKYHDWKDFLVKRLTGARTVPADFHKKVEESLSSRFKIDMALEVVDKNRISNMRVAYVEQNIGGRLHVIYRHFDSPDDSGFWCHERSPLIHPCGWSRLIEHDITPVTANEDTSDPQLTYQEFVAKWDMFLHPKAMPVEVQFKEGMKLEAIDPLNLSTICVASVAKVLKHDYLMIGIDGYNEKGTDWFCHHATSVSIFPAGFCNVNGIELTPPRGHRGEFKWEEYLKVTKAVAAPVSLFHRELLNHGFKPGMRLEAVDLMEPRLLCVGTITKVVGRLLRVHFDGWDITYDQWCDCESPDLYPVGWCETVGYHLEPPRNLVDMSLTSSQNSQDALDKKRKGKTQQNRGPKKKKKGKVSVAGKLQPKSIPRITLAGKVTKRKSYREGGGGAKISSSKATKSKTVTERLSMTTEDVSISSSSDEDDDDEEEEEEDNPVQLSSRQRQGNSQTTIDAELNDSGVVRNSDKHIPKLVGGGGASLTTYQRVITPELWTTFDVSQFLRINDCGAYSESFSRKRIDGRKFLTLTKEQIVNLTGMKVGPSLKIFDLIQQLKSKI